MERIANNSNQSGLTKSRLPTFTNQWIKTIRGTADFLGVNYYTSRFVEDRSEPEGTNPSFDRDRNLDEIVRKEWKRAATEWLYSVPQGFGDLLRYSKCNFLKTNLLMIII